MQRPLRPAIFERRLYRFAACLITVLVFAGFARTFFLSFCWDQSPLSNLLIVHGILMTLWIALFFAQVVLIDRHRLDWHRWLGKSGGWLLVLMVGFGVAITVVAGREQRQLGIMPTVDIALFTGLIGTGLWFHRRSAFHKRLLLLGTLVMLLPAIARIPVPALADAGVVGQMALSVLIVIGFVTIDTIKHRRLHPAFGWGAALVVLSMPMRLWLESTAVWAAFATWAVT